MKPSVPQNSVLSRRAMLGLTGRGIGLAALTAALQACGGGSSGGGSSTGPAPDPTPTPEPSAARIPAASPEYAAVKRTSFGINAASLSRAEALGVDDFLEEQLNYQQIDSSALDTVIAATFPLAALPPNQLRGGFPGNAGDIVGDLVKATAYRALFSPRQLYEVMVEFWSNHFNIQVINGIEPVLKPWDDAQVIRPNALGSFSDMLNASAHSSAMLFYLDNFLNTAQAPNENYARELLELHTLGVDGGYTEQDIKEIARCFTGWTISFATGEFAFVPALHDDGDKLVLGQQIPAGGGQADGETVLAMLATHPSTARFIALKLCRRFIADQPPEAAIDRVAAAFSGADGDIRATMRALFQESAFLDQADSKFVRPMEFLGQLVRALNPDLDLPADEGRFLFGISAVMGQIPFYWPAPDGYPDAASYWANTSGLLNRWRIALGVTYGRVYPLDQLVGGANTIDGIVDALSDAVLMRPLHAEDRQLIVGWLMEVTGLAADLPQQDAVVAELLPATASLLLSSTYFQLR